MGSQRFAEPWLQHILKLNKHSHSHELQEILQSHTPADSIDPHLLNAIAQSLSIRTVLSPIASNYHITAKTPSCHAHHIDTPLLLSTLHYKHTLQHARARANTTLPTAYLVPKDHAQALLRAHPELVPIITVKKDQLAVWPSSFWEGGTGVMNLTYHRGSIPSRLTPLFPHTNNQSPHISIRQDAVHPPPFSRTSITQPPRHSHRNPPPLTLLTTGPPIQPHTQYSHTRGHPRLHHHGLDRHTIHITTQSTPPTTQTTHDTPPRNVAGKEQGGTPSGRGPANHHQTTP